MSSSLLTSQIGQRISLPGHFDVPVVLEDARPLGSDDSAGYECRVRLPDGSLEEAVISAEEVVAVLKKEPDEAKAETPVDAEKLRLLIESARVRLAYAHDQQFAVSLSGIRTLPHQIEAVYQAMLPQPRLRFLLADDPGAGKTIMAAPCKIELREAIEPFLSLSPLRSPYSGRRDAPLVGDFDYLFRCRPTAIDQLWQRSSQIIASIDYAKMTCASASGNSGGTSSSSTRPTSVSPDSSGGQNRESKVATTKRYDLASRLTSHRPCPPPDCHTPSWG